MDQKKNNNEFAIPVQGSLGILALGDIGLRAWRAVKNKNSVHNKNEKK